MLKGSRHVILTSRSPSKKEGTFASSISPFEHSITVLNVYYSCRIKGTDRSGTPDRFLMRANKYSISSNSKRTYGQ